MIGVQHSDVQITLSWHEAENLRTALPWLLHALADRPTLPPRQRERRRKAQTIFERLQTLLSSQPPHVEESGESQG